MDLKTYGAPAGVTVYAGMCSGGPYNGNYLEYHHIIFPVRIESINHENMQKIIKHGYYRAVRNSTGDWEWIPPNNT